MRTWLTLLMLCSFSYSNATSEQDSIEIHERFKMANAIDDQHIPDRIAAFDKLSKFAQQKKFNPRFIHRYLLYSLASDYSRIGDFDRAIELGNELITYFASVKDTSYTIALYNNVGVFCTSQGSYKKAQNYYHRGLHLAKQGGTIEDLIDFYDGLSSTSISLKNQVAAQAYLKLSLEKLTEAGIPLTEDFWLYYHLNKAKYDLLISNRSSAEIELLKAIEIGEALKLRKLVNLRIELAEVYLTSNQFQEALFQYKKVLTFYNNGDNSTKYDPYLMQTYAGLAQINYRQGDFRKTLIWVELANEQSEFYHQLYMFRDSKFFLNDYIRKNQELGALCSYELWKSTGKIEYAEQSLNYADGAKSKVLEEMRNIRNQSISATDKSLFLSCLYQIAELERAKESAMAMQVRNRLDSLKKSLSLTASIGHEKIKLWQIQPILDEDQIIVDYLICDAEIIFYIIDNKELTCLKFEYELDKKIVQFHEVLQNPNSSLAEFKTLSNAIYTAILEPISKLKPKARNLYIIPDQQLNYVSFDVLISDLNGVSWQDLSYVLKKYTVSYGFSLRSLLEEAAQSTTRERKNYVGFAPNFTSFPELPTLSTAQMAVKKGRKIFGGSNFLDQESTYENLRIHGQFCSILQLYTHAVVVIDGNYKSSYIYLADRKMYVNEILAMPMDVDLCLLTACDVGLGKHHASEGLTGVAWAFRGAGAKNIVQAMWKINENSSATLIESLFTELNNQQLSTHALRNAKLSFLQSSEISNRMKHPHYWAGMNHYGKGVIIPKRNHWWNWVAMAFGMAIIAGLIIWRNAAIKLKLKTSEMHAPSL